MHLQPLTRCHWSKNNLAGHPSISNGVGNSNATHTYTNTHTRCLIVYPLHTRSKTPQKHLKFLSLKHTHCIEIVRKHRWGPSRKRLSPDDPQSKSHPAPPQHRQTQTEIRKADKAEQSHLMRQWRTHCFPLLELQTPNNTHTHTQLVALSSTLPARRPLGVCVWMACSCLDRSVERGGSWKDPPPLPQHRAAPATWAGRCTWHPYDSPHLFSQCRKAIPVTLTCYGSPLLEGGGKKKKSPLDTPPIARAQLILISSAQAPGTKRISEEVNLCFTSGLWCAQPTSHSSNFKLNISSSLAGFSSGSSS